MGNAREFSASQRVAAEAIGTTLLLAILSRVGSDRFRALSAGGPSEAAPHPLTLRLLADYGCDVSGLRSKSWDEFAMPERRLSV